MSTGAGSRRKGTIVLRAAIIGLLAGLSFASAQDMGVLKRIQFHGDLSQGFLFSSANNYLTTESSDGSFRWTEGALNFRLPLTDNLKTGIQLHSYSLGQIGRQTVTVDWAFAEYKFNNYLGIRAGKVKTPMGLFNEVQDIDAAYPWVLLPQSVYPADMRSFHLAHTGFVAYGDFHLPGKAGSISWQGYAGSRSQARGEGFMLQLREEGTILGHASGPTLGADVRWTPPLSGLIIGASYLKTNLNAPTAVTDGAPAPGKFKYDTEDFYAQYQKGKLELDAEFNIEPTWESWGGQPYHYNPSRIWYLMGSWHVTSKLTTGMYYSRDFGFDSDTRDRSDPGNYSKETALNARYDFNRFLYGKIEGHYIDGVANGFYPSNNPNGLDKVTKVLLARVGFVF
jgi:hypothetical protein